MINKIITINVLIVVEPSLLLDLILELINVTSEKLCSNKYRNYYNQRKNNSHTCCIAKFPKVKCSVNHINGYCSCYITRSTLCHNLDDTICFKICSKSINSRGTNYIFYNGKNNAKKLSDIPTTVNFTGFNETCR